MPPKINTANGHRKPFLTQSIVLRRGSHLDCFVEPCEHPPRRDLNAALVARTGRPLAELEAEGIAAHRAAARRREAEEERAKIQDAVLKARRREVQATWACAVPSTPATHALPLAARAAYGVLIARAHAVRGGGGGVTWQARVAVIEVQHRLLIGRGAAKRALNVLKARGLVLSHVGRRREARRSEINSYELLDPAAIVAAASRKFPGLKIESHLPNGRSQHQDTTVQGARLRRAGLHDGRANRHDPAPQRPILVELSRPEPDHPPGHRPERPSADAGGAVPSLAAQAERLLSTRFAALRPSALIEARLRHGPWLTALAVVAAAAHIRARDGTEAPIRDGPAYLAGMLRRRQGELHPERSIARIAARSAREGAIATAAGQSYDDAPLVARQ